MKTIALIERFQMRNRKILATIAATTIGLSAFAAPVATGQSSTNQMSNGGSSLATGSSQGWDSFKNLLGSDSSMPENAPDQEDSSNTDFFYRLGALAANLPSSNGGSVEGALSSASLFGAQGSSLPDIAMDRPEGYPLPINADINELKLVNRETDDPHNGRDRVERWYVQSPAMKRVVEVQVLVPKDNSASAPMLYMLDGIDAPRNNGWVQFETLHKFFEDKNVIVVMPTQAPGSLYTDWVADDPQLGRNKWETFISKELPQIMEAEANGLNYNGKKGIGGLSMGAMGAVRNAALHPDVWDATMGISGCYSTMDPLGAMISKVVVESRGGSLDNMWGKKGSDEWKRNDITLNPRGLKDMAVYLSAADGYLDEANINEYKGQNSVQNMMIGAYLEQGTHQCTKKLDAAMKRAGMTHQKVDYKVGGAHGWLLFNSMLEPGWNHIKGALGA